ncbi:hypothetical protein OG478_52520 [Streptomyces phaeochromogenes]|uniref:hypothetical protein n=1 Tax=Streptomyces phaeochromogenes TaxID=1923 RepID=UPI00386D4215|nr:hypothetical protein OG478_00220 [Streptomyces phaeochromogenes]WSS99660.1 hypothetical protein OG478_52520 [Streptomyces phaeochromogenes]
MPDQAAAREAKSHVLNTVLSRMSDTTQVTGVGLGQRGGDWIVRVNLREDNRQVRQEIPPEVGGVPVVVEVGGTVRAHATSTPLTAGQRPHLPRLIVWLILIALLLTGAITAFLVT